jgi:hypothetical protein
MTKRTLSRVLICLGMLVLVKVNVSAQASNDGVITINGGRDTILLRAPSQAFVPAVPQSSKLVTIYSNLGKGNNVYNSFAGYGILGVDAGQPWREWVGCGFRPRADHTVTEIQVGASYVQGTNGLVLSLNEDNNHRPGKALHTWHFAGLPSFGSCCTLETGKIATGIKVKKGRMYWVVLRPSATDTYDVWNNNFKGVQGAFSNNIGPGWTEQSFQTLTAFGVFGK